MSKTMEKLLSVRAIVTVMVIVTLCTIVFKCLDLLITNIDDAQKFDRIKDVVMYLFGAFISVVTMATTAYFNRSDRWKENEKGGQQ
jgi:FtsH-binding integral membrane protein